VAGLFGLGRTEPQRAPRARRGDVRTAILGVLAEEPMNGYQVIQTIGERSNGGWRPSPGSVYPTISQLEDEGLITSADETGRRTLRLTDEGHAWVADHAEEVAEVFAPFAGPGPRTEDPRTHDQGEREGRGDFASLKPELGQVMSAVWQIITTGTEKQKRDAIEVLVDARRRLYGLLAEGDTE
jgi:DNA-binding PadR family transcriptional regulator